MIFGNNIQFVIMQDIYPDIPLPSAIEMVIKYNYDSNGSPHIAFISYADISQFLVCIFKRPVQNATFVKTLIGFHNIIRHRFCHHIRSHIAEAQATHTICKNS